MSEPDPKPSKQPETKRPFQFGLKSLFVVTLVWALACAIAAQSGAPVLTLSILSVALTLAVVGIWFRQTRPVTFAGAVLLLLVALLLPSVEPATQSARRVACHNHLKQLGVALQNYHSFHGCFPPAYIADESGRPMHSWRVLILPWIEEEQIYRAYNFDEPWDGPNNRKLAKRLVRVFHCPADDHDDNEDEWLMTNYVAVVGPATAWPGDKSSKIDDFADGTANTILVVEVADSGIHWMEPRDLHILQMAPGINPKAGQGISSKHFGGAAVCFADGTVRFLSEDLSVETVRALLTRNGGEKVDPDEF